MKKHLLITGLVRTGTTFLVAYYHMLGFITGYPRNASNKVMAKNHRTHGGMEFLNVTHRIAKRNLAEVEVIKHPWSYGAPPPRQKIEKFDLQFDHIILTSREYEKYAKSLAHAHSKRLILKESKKQEREEKAFKAAPLKMKELEEWVKATGSNIIRIEFPKSIYDFEYLWENLQPTMKKIKKERANKVWLALQNPDYINFQ